MNNSDYQLMSDKAHEIKLKRMYSAQTFAPSVAPNSGRPMQVKGPAGEIFVAHKVSGEKPDWSHVIVPFRKSLLDAALFSLLALIIQVVVFRNDWLVWVGIADFAIYNSLLYIVALCVDWFFFGNSSVLDLKTKDTWVVPEVEQPQEVIGAAPVVVEIEHLNGRKRIVPNAAPNGWDAEKLLVTCQKIKAGGMAFSQPKTGLSSHSYDKLKEHWLMLDFIELQDGFENRFQLTPAGEEFVKNYAN